MHFRIHAPNALSPGLIGSEVTDGAILSPRCLVGARMAFGARLAANAIECEIDVLADRIWRDVGVVLVRNKMAARALGTRMSPFHRVVVVVSEVRSGPPDLLIMTTLAFLRQTTGVNVGVTINALLRETQIGRLTRMGGKTRQHKGRRESHLMTPLASQLVMRSCKGELNVRMHEIIGITSSPRQRVDQRETRSEMFGMALRTLAAALACQEGMIPLVCRHLLGDLLVTGETTFRQSLLRVASIARSQSGPLDDLGMRRRERPRHRVERDEVHAQQTDHHNAEQKWCSWVQ
jgi:hypothetical protein